MSTQALIGGYQPSQVTEDDQLRVEAQRKLMNEKLGWSFLFYRVSAKWTQAVNGENIFYHLVADRNFRCSVNFYKSLQGGIDLQVTFGAMGWVGPRSHRSEKLGEEEEKIVFFYEQSEVTESDIFLVHKEHRQINEAMGWECDKYTITKKFVEVFFGGKNFYYQMFGDNHLKCSVNFLLTSRQIRPRITLADKDQTTPTPLLPTSHETELRPNQFLDLAKWLPVKITEQDQLLLNKYRDQINKHLGWSSNGYRPDSKWVLSDDQIFFSTYYFLTSQGNDQCSVCFKFVVEQKNGKEAIQFEVALALEGWIQPQPIGNQIGIRPKQKIDLAKWQPVKLTSKDLGFVNKHRDQINQKLGWSSKSYRPQAKWILIDGQVLPSSFYQLTSDNNQKCSVRFSYLINEKGKLQIKVTFASKGQILPKPLQNLAGNGPQKVEDKSLRNPAWEPSIPTAEDQKFVQDRLDDINKKLGWSCAAYRAYMKWKQVVVGGMNIFYLLVGDFHLECSVNIFSLLGESYTVKFACDGWVQPQRYNLRTQAKLDPGFKKVPVIQGDFCFVNEYGVMINKQGKWNYNDYTPVEKWVRPGLAGQDPAYHLLGDEKFKCTTYFYKKLVLGQLFQEVRVEKGWVPIK